MSELDNSLYTFVLWPSSHGICQVLEWLPVHASLYFDVSFARDIGSSDYQWLTVSACFVPSIWHWTSIRDWVIKLSTSVHPS